MKYALIDTDGRVHQRAGDWAAELGPEGFDRVGLHRSLPMAAWVNDVGLRKPDVYPINLVGSAVLGFLGAAPRALAGPIVVTGFRHQPVPDVADLQPVYAAYLWALHVDLGRVLEAGGADALAARPPAETAPAGQAPPLRYLPVDSLPAYGGPN